MAKEKAAADAKTKAEADAAAKKAADELAAAKAKGDKALTEKLAKEKAAADEKAKADAEKLAKDKAAADAKAKAEAEALKQKEIKDKTNGTIIPVLASGDVKYKEAIKNADNFFGTKRYRDAKKYYEEALTFKGGDTYAKGKLIECEKFLNSDAAQTTDDRIKQLLAKYSPGVTEETISGSGFVILQRVVVKDNNAWVYQKKIFSWGGVSHFRDGVAITESTFDIETKP